MQLCAVQRAATICTSNAGKHRSHLRGAYQHRHKTASGLDSAEYLHMSETGLSFEDKDKFLLDKEQRLFQRGVEEAIYGHTLHRVKH